MPEPNVTADKLFLLLRAPDDVSVARFQDQAGPAARANLALTTARQLSLCRIGPAPEGLPRRPDDPADPRPPIDVAIRARFADPLAARQAFAALSVQGALMPGVTPLAFLVCEIPVLDRLRPDQQAAVKNLALIQFHDDLPDSAARRSWAQHAKLAAGIHVGAGRYVRNWVEARSANAPPVRGIVEIDFATVPDLTERYFAPPDGMARIIQDTGHFVGRATRLYMVEEQLRPSPA